MDLQIGLNRFISAQEFGARFKSKRECHRFITVDAGAYLPVIMLSQFISCVT